MKLLEELVAKLEDKLNWETLKNSSNLVDILNDYKKNMNNLSKEYANDIQGKIRDELDIYKTFQDTVITELKVLANTTGVVMPDMLKEIENKMGIENAYLSIRSVYADLKERISASGEVPDEFERAMLNELETNIFRLGLAIPNQEDLWDKYKAIQDILGINADALLSEKDPNWGNGGSNGGTGNGGTNTGGGVTVDGKDNQSHFHWGQGNGKDYLGIKETQNTFSGTDMLATINVPGKGPIVFGELSQLSYSVYREKVPIRTLGRITPKGYTRGLRTITGVMVFTIFDRSIVYECMDQLHRDGYRILMDEMPVFDITVTMANEFGHKSTMTLYGVSTYSEGQMMGVDMLSVQNAYEFYAIDIDPMKRMDDDRTLQGSSVIDKNGDIIRDQARNGVAGYYKDIYSLTVNQQKALDMSNKFTFGEKV